EGGPIDLDEQYLFQSGLGYMSARQQALELAKVVGRVVIHWELLGILLESGHGMMIGACPFTGLIAQIRKGPLF
ncbi:MAG: hypothetical protein ACKPKO_21000, partial [Candidatus Fonsibacter sp.]